ncbi:MAG: DUF1565 domain-containing protein, partial [candidate division Zixibacteria bacterium]|nr:DUF1565 domain-containing protein [candidate division Zixibacteria bacterium]
MKRFLLLLSCFLVLAVASNGWAAVWYVRTDGSDLNDGQSWNSAFATIQKAVTSAAASDQIWVSAGTYFPQSSIRVDKPVSIYGGFNGSEAGLEERDWITNVTTVDGNNGVSSFYVRADARIDGFTITNGYTYQYNGGGGILNFRASPTIANCVFDGNSAVNMGGAITNYFYSSPTIINSIFHGNTTEQYGGAIANFIGSSPTITNCTFYNNSA